MTNEERAAQIIGGLPYGERTSVIAAALKAANLLAPEPEPKYRWTSRGDVSDGVQIKFYGTDATTAAERACVLAALNAMDTP